MNYKLKENLQDVYLFIPQINGNIIGKFIPEEMFPYLYRKYPEFFEIEEPKLIKGLKQKIEEIKKEDVIFINNDTKEGDITEQ